VVGFGGRLVLDDSVEDDSVVVDVVDVLVAVEE